MLQYCLKKKADQIEREHKFAYVAKKYKEKALAAQVLYVERVARKTKEMEIADRVAVEKQKAEAATASATLRRPTVFAHSAMGILGLAGGNSSSLAV